LCTIVELYLIDMLFDILGFDLVRMNFVYIDVLIVELIHVYHQ